MKNEKTYKVPRFKYIAEDKSFHAYQMLTKNSEFSASHYLYTLCLYILPFQWLAIHKNRSLPGFGGADLF
jgi:hypothetical protein